MFEIVVPCLHLFWCKFSIYIYIYICYNLDMYLVYIHEWMCTCVFNDFHIVFIA